MIKNANKKQYDKALNYFNLCAVLCIMSMVVIWYMAGFVVYCFAVFGIVCFFVANVIYELFLRDKK